uniref:U-scoloptoxin(15)-Er1a n=1 Tax=Ethmostigmus rubripes TaxID=62613 RepID=TXF1A_ETHRU|nr:RecName: Full=U-scoloptoxin(15)-Er1a; Short=U-SLPTX(15)-Er1a; Flags: Precursor [Ethmostigmus rubripes]
MQNKGVVLTLFLVVSMAIVISSTKEKRAVIQKKYVDFKDRKYPWKEECFETCARTFTNGDQSKVSEVVPDYFKCICYVLI